MELSKLLTENLIISNLKGSNKYQIIEEMIIRIDEELALKDKNLAMKNVMEREQYLSTGLENGLAVPHGKSHGVSKLVIAFGVSREGVDFDSLDGKSTHLIFLILSPKNTSGPHIQVLAQITRKFRNKALQKNILKASSANDILKAFKLDGGLS